MKCLEPGEQFSLCGSGLWGRKKKTRTWTDPKQNSIHTNLSNKPKGAWHKLKKKLHQQEGGEALLCFTAHTDTTTGWCSRVPVQFTCPAHKAPSLPRAKVQLITASPPQQTALGELPWLLFNSKATAGTGRGSVVLTWCTRLFSNNGFIWMSCWRGRNFHRLGCNGDNLHYGLYGQEQSCMSEDIFPSYPSFLPCGRWSPATLKPFQSPSNPHHIQPCYIVTP